MLELLVVLVVIGILSELALPYYQQHLRKGRRFSAEKPLLNWSQQFEFYYQQHLH